MKETSCPSCGAPITFKSSVALMLVCEFCDSRIIRRDLNLEDLGKMAQLQDDGSVIQLGSRGRFEDAPFEMIGRIQLKYDYGYWNEWFLSYADGRSGWLGETQGTYAISFPLQHQGLPPMAALKPGMPITLGGEAFTVRDIQEAMVIGGEGELPFEVGSGYGVTSVDCAGEGYRFATLDYSEDPPLVYAGYNMDFDELGLTDLKEIEGW